MISNLKGYGVFELNHSLGNQFLVTMRSSLTALIGLCCIWLVRLIQNRLFNSLYQLLMNNFALSYKRYWQPSYLQATSISLIAGAVSSFITYPMEFCKTVIQFQGTGVGFRGRRPQQQGYNPFKILRQIHETGAGLSGLYEGFDAHLIGRLSYLFVRNTIYAIIYNQVKPAKPYNDLSYREKAVIAGVAGIAGAIVSHPFTVISIRQVLDTQIKPEWRRGYSDSAVKAVNELVASGEVWQGLKVNILRHLIYNVSLTGPYDYFKQGLFTRFGEYGWVDPFALLCATAVSSAVTLPIDNIRTRMIQLHKQLDRNRINFNTIQQGISKAIDVETHPLSLWAGYYTFFPQMFVYAWLTVGITNAFTESWKRKEGLLEWQI